ncbi:sensor histidine kinase [Phytomonospora endophytica]|uniref:histidine kinase n=1 Tax=Phytomonospora endophytica TaxID=714109 RepID=A0A841FMP0_9ACTN|nr:histidine kinase [Phytomonospora endophytica]MBB6035068.1 signal transduction histidine kinase [Phytomonospora endophytica]GIG64185.1 two-component sensor histidine kinase [Phytomonospora endophytica]
MRRIPVFLSRHPRLADVTMLGHVLAVDAISMASIGKAGVLGWAVLLGAHVPLVWRRKAPSAVFWAVYAYTVATTPLDVPGAYQLIVPMVALHAVARHRSWRHLLPALGGVTVVVVLAALFEDAPGSTLIPVVSVAGAVTLLGLTFRTRAAWAEEVRARIRRGERERIAREMHDIVAHNLAVMIALADGASLTVPSSPERAAEAMRNAASTGREALSEMRRLLGVLRTDDESRVDEPQPGLADLPGLVERVRASGVETVLDWDGDEGGCGRGPGLALYRIAQEALTNTIKHAGPGARAVLRLRCTRERAELEIDDDGARRVFAPGPAAGLGIPGMTERAESYGGGVETGPAPDGGGWRVRAWLSFEEAR